jgi:hypothetical protein
MLVVLYGGYWEQKTVAWLDGRSEAACCRSVLVSNMGKIWTMLNSETEN